MTLASHSQPPSSSPLLWELRLTKASLQLPPTNPAPAGPLTPPPPSPGAAGEQQRSDGTEIRLGNRRRSHDPLLSSFYAPFFPSSLPGSLHLLLSIFPPCLLLLLPVWPPLSSCSLSLCFGAAAFVLWYQRWFVAPLAHVSVCGLHI